MPPFAKLFSPRWSLVDSLNLHDSCATISLVPLSPPATERTASCSGPKAWSCFQRKVKKAYRKTRKFGSHVATSLKYFSSCTAKPAAKDDDDEYTAPVSELVKRSSSSVYFECQDSFTQSSNDTLDGMSKQRAGSQTERKEGMSQALQVHVEVVDEWAGEWQGDGWDCAPGVAEHIIQATGLGRFLEMRMMSRETWYCWRASGCTLRCLDTDGKMSSAGCSGGWMKWVCKGADTLLLVYR